MHLPYSNMCAWCMFMWKGSACKKGSNINFAIVCDQGQHDMKNNIFSFFVALYKKLNESWGTPRSCKYFTKEIFLPLSFTKSLSNYPTLCSNQLNNVFLIKQIPFTAVDVHGDSSCVYKISWPCCFCVCLCSCLWLRQAWEEVRHQIQLSKSHLVILHPGLLRQEHISLYPIFLIIMLMLPYLSCIFL